MLTIRFSRVGKRNHAQYKVVLAEKTSPIKGRFVEVLGSYDPHQKKAALKTDRIKYWIGKGAGCSDTAYNLFVKEGILEGKKRAVKLPSKKVEEAPAEAAAVEAVPTEKPAQPETEATPDEKPKAE